MGEQRRKLPNRRRSWTQRAVVGGTTCYLTCGEYDDGTLGEIFVVVAKAGSALRATTDAFARNFSVALQHGTPLETLLSTHRGLDFLPNGRVLTDDSGSLATRASSILDWVVQELENAYVKRVRREPRRLDPPAPEKIAGPAVRGSGH